jgi:hypothetical protein
MPGPLPFGRSGCAVDIGSTPIQPTRSRLCPIPVSARRAVYGPSIG